MTDYEKDYNAWKNDQSIYSDFKSEPKRSDYDEYGYKKNSVIYDGNLILDKYLVKTHGIEYARQNPLKVLNKPAKDLNMLKIVKELYKKTLGYQLDKTIITTDNGIKHIHSDEFLDEHPERRDNPEFTKEEEKEALTYLAQLAISKIIK